MINANELRIGNWVKEQVLGTVFVSEINQNCASVCCKNLTESKQVELAEYSILYDNLSPIELSEDTLIKCGFEKRNTPTQFGWYLSVSKNRVLCWCHSKIVSLEFDYDDYDYNGTLFEFPCDSLHNLQNAFYSLTGTELNYKP